MKRFGLAVALLCWLLAAPVTAGTLTGQVFLDTNGNSARDPGEQGVPGCVVSDERTLTRTDTEGRYRLALPDGPATLFVVNAPDTWPGKRWWYAIPDGAADGTRDFALRADKQDGPFYFVHGTDMHTRPDTLPLYRRYIEHVNSLPVPIRFAVHTGDLVLDSNVVPPLLARLLFNGYEKASRELKIPLRNLPGNHEVVGCRLPGFNPTAPGYGKSLYREQFGPETYAFRYGRYHCLALDGTLMLESGVTYGLTPESAAWAQRYLADVRADEPIILLIHEPLENRPTEKQLLAALQGKKLLAVLCGHGHARTQSIWGGAPQIMGGSVSYAWHGFLPFPPQPYGYVLYRVDGDTIEHVFLDWAAERAFDVAIPAWTSVTGGKQTVRGIVDDPKGEITALECRVGDLKATAALARQGTLAQEFTADLDLTALPDGVYDLQLMARAGEKQWEKRQPILVINGRETEFGAKEPAALTFRVGGVAGSGNQVLLNGQPLFAIPADAVPTQELSLTIPPERLRALNSLTFQAAQRGTGYDRLQVRSVWLEYGDHRYRDIRFAPGQSRAARTPEPGKAPVVTAYIDLRYQEEKTGD